MPRTGGTVRRVTNGTWLDHEPSTQRLEPLEVPRAGVPWRTIAWLALGALFGGGGVAGLGPQLGGGAQVPMQIEEQARTKLLVEQHESAIKDLGRKLDGMTAVVGETRADVRAIRVTLEQRGRR